MYYIIYKNSIKYNQVYTYINIFLYIIFMYNI